jgi:hypothetical protein
MLELTISLCEVLGNQNKIIEMFFNCALTRETKMKKIIWWTWIDVFVSIILFLIVSMNKIWQKCLLAVTAVSSCMTTSITLACLRFLNAALHLEVEKGIQA